MATRPQGKLTYEDYIRFPDDGRRYELIDGEAYMVPGPNTQHQRVVGYLGRKIGNHLERHGGGEVLVSPYDVVLSDPHVVQPDVIYVAEADAGIVTERCIRGAPTWLIEVVSDPVRDTKVKRDLYAAHGVAEYWALDPVLERLEIYTLEDGAYGPPEIVEPGARPSPRALPELEIDVAEALER